jgi:hypothetical protein
MWSRWRICWGRWSRWRRSICWDSREVKELLKKRKHVEYKIQKRTKTKEEVNGGRTLDTTKRRRR